MGVSSNASGIKAGTVAYFGASTAPAGFIKANGAAVSRAAYAALFNVIGTTFGAGDGATTFNVPDLRGEFVRGFDDGRGVDSGRGIGTEQPATKIGSTAVYSVVIDVTNGEEMAAIANQPAYNASNYSSPTSRLSVRPRNVAMLACIKY